MELTKEEKWQARYYQARDILIAFMPQMDKSGDAHIPRHSNGVRIRDRGLTYWEMQRLAKLNTRELTTLILDMELHGSLVRRPAGGRRATEKWQFYIRKEYGR